MNHTTHADWTFTQPTPYRHGTFIVLNILGYPLHYCRQHKLMCWFGRTPEDANFLGEEYSAIAYFIARRLCIRLEANWRDMPRMLS